MLYVFQRDWTGGEMRHFCCSSLARLPLKNKHVQIANLTGILFIFSELNIFAQAITLPQPFFSSPNLTNSVALC